MLLGNMVDGVVHGVMDGGNGGSVDNGSVVGDGGGVHNRGNSLGNGVNESVHVDILGESLEGQRTEATVGGDEVAEGSGQGTGNGSVDIGISGGGAQGGAEEGADNSKGLCWCVSLATNTPH